MFDHRVAECDFEASVPELSEIRGITRKGSNVFVALLFGFQIQTKNPNVGTVCPPAIFPELIRSSHIENSQRTRKRCHQRLKPLEPPAAKPVRKGVGILAFGQLANRWDRKIHYSINLR